MICANVNASAGASMVLDGRLVIKIVKILAVGFFSILAMAGAAQAQGLIWAKRAGGTMIGDAGIGTSVDGLGNSYITGNFQGTASFGSTMLASAGSDDIFVAKYDSNGNLLWAKKDGGMGSDRGAGIAVDGLGNSYVTGVFNGTAIFGPGEANEVSLASNGSEDIFVAKYASDGTFIWATKAGGPGADQGARVAVDGSGNSFVTGFFNGTATFGAGEPNETMLTSSNGSDDIFVAKFDSTGALLWAKKAGGSGLDRGSGIALDGSGSSYATGFFSGIATFESTSLTSAGDWDVFLAKYDSSGTLVWAKRAGGSNRDRSFSVAVDGLGNSYVSGLFNGSATFGFGEANQTMLTSVGLDDVFLANFDATGVLRWAKRAGGTGSDGGQSIAVDDLGNSYVTGFFNGITHPGPATFGLGELNQTTLISAGDRDIFFAKYNVNGRLVWVTRAGGASTDQGMAIAVDQLGNSFATGFFAANFGGGSATFGFAEENETTLISAGNEDIFIAKFRNSDAVQFNNLAATAGENVLAGGIESNGVGRGPAFQLFDPSGLLQFTQFVLNPDFTDTNFIPGNFDVDTAGEVLVGGRESLGSSRGPAYQLFDTNGAFMFTRFVLNPDFTGLSFSPFSVSSTNGALVCGRETLGVARGPAYQAFDSGGNLVRTQFALNTDFITDNSCIGANLDGVLGDEAILGGREVTGAARGPAIQAFNSNGSLRFTRFVLNPNFSETGFIVADISSTGIIAFGRETSGSNRGPAYQTYDGVGNLILTRFVLNSDFTRYRVFGANTTNGVIGDEIVTAGTETGGAARGPAMQVWDRNGNLLLTRFVLNPDFTEVKFHKIDINNDGVDEIIVVGRETSGAARGPAFQIFDGSGTLLVTQFVLNNDFTNLRFFPVDQNNDGDQEIGIGGIETSGQFRGPGYQIFESSGALLLTQFVLNPDF